MYVEAQPCWVQIVSWGVIKTFINTQLLDLFFLMQQYYCPVLPSIDVLLFVGTMIAACRQETTKGKKPRIQKSLKPQSHESQEARLENRWKIPRVSVG